MAVFFDQTPKGLPNKEELAGVKPRELEFMSAKEHEKFLQKAGLAPEQYDFKDKSTSEVYLRYSLSTSRDISDRAFIVLRVFCPLELASKVTPPLYHQYNDT